MGAQGLSGTSTIFYADSLLIGCLRMIRDQHTCPVAEEGLEKFSIATQLQEPFAEKYFPMHHEKASFNCFL